MTVFWRYWLLQIPGWIVLGVALASLNRWFGLSLGFCAAIFTAWLVKDGALYPILRKHFELRSESGTGSLLGQRAVAAEPLRPRGYVRLRGELWLAELPEGGASAGDEVIVEAVEGLTLRVRTPSD